MINLVMQIIDTNQAKKIRFNNQCYNQIYVITVIHILLLKELLLDNAAYDKKVAFKNKALFISCITIY